MAFFIKGDGMKKFEIVKEHQEFNDIISDGEMIKNNLYIIYIRKSNFDFPRFGLAVGKKIGNAVNRNKQKRRLRMILTNHKKEFSKSYDYIIIMKGKCNEVDFQELESSLITLISKRRKQ